MSETESDRIQPEPVAPGAAKKPWNAPEVHEVDYAATLAAPAPNVFDGPGPTYIT